MISAKYNTKKSCYAKSAMRERKSETECRFKPQDLSEIFNFD